MADVDLTARVLAAGESVEIQGTVAGSAVNLTEGTDTTRTFVAGDVNAGTDRITEASHGLVAGQKVQISTSGTLPAGISASTNYYVKSIDANTIELYTEQDLTNIVDITDGGSGTHTINAYYPLTLNIDATPVTCVDTIGNNIKYKHYVIPTASRPTTGNETLTFDMAAGGIESGANSSPAYDDQACTNNTGTELLASLGDVTSRIAMCANIADINDWWSADALVNKFRQTRWWIDENANEVIPLADRNDAGIPKTWTGSYAYTYGPFQDWQKRASGTLKLYWNDETEKASPGTGTTDITCHNNMSSGAKTWNATREQWQRTITLSDSSGTATIRINNAGDGADISACPILVWDGDDDETNYWTQTTHQRIRPFKRVRFMTSEGLNQQNRSKPVNTADLPADGVSNARNSQHEILTATITSITTYVGASAAWDGMSGRTRLHVTCSSAHGLENGDSVVLTGTDGDTGGTTHNGTHIAWVIDADEFFFSHLATGSVTDSTTGTMTSTLYAGLDIETKAALCNEAGIAELHLCLPPGIKDAAVTSMATRLNAVLDSNVKVYLEIANENWNYNSFMVMKAEADLASLNNISEYETKRTKEFVDLFDAQLGAGRSVAIYAGQASVTTYINNMINYHDSQSYTHSYECSIAPYWGAGATSPFETELKRLTPSGVIDIMHSNVDVTIRAQVAAHFALTDAASVPLTCYEGGQHLVSGGDSDIQTLFTKVQFHPRMANLQWFGLKMLQDEGCLMGNQYYLEGRWSPATGFWGAYDVFDQVAGVGDGSDGKQDNTVDLTDRNNNVSVVAYALEQWVGTGDQNIMLTKVG